MIYWNPFRLLLYHTVCISQFPKSVIIPEPSFTIMIISSSRSTKSIAGGEMNVNIFLLPLYITKTILFNFLSLHLFSPEYREGELWSWAMLCVRYALCFLQYSPTSFTTFFLSLYPSPVDPCTSDLDMDKEKGANRSIERATQKGSSMAPLETTKKKKSSRARAVSRKRA